MTNCLLLTIVSCFLAGNPDDHFGEDCLSIYINDGYWNDDNCEHKRGYICKRRGETRIQLWLITETNVSNMLVNL